MNTFPEGNAIIYCEGAFGTPNGKTAHGLLRRSHRYQVLAIVDSAQAGRDSGEILTGAAKSVPIFSSVTEAVAASQNTKFPATHFVIGLAPDGGRLGMQAKQDVIRAIQLGLNIDSGLHDFLSDDSEIMAAAQQYGVQIRDVRKPPPRNQLHFFSGKIEQVTSLKIAILGTDSAVGKRTTAWILVDALIQHGFSAEFVGTGQTAWLQGARYSIMLDSLINDFVSGEIEHAVWSAWHDNSPDVIVIEGQGSLMNPAFPGGFEILAAARPDFIILQHAPARKDYDGFPGYPIDPVEKQIQVIELISGKPVIAITINHEHLSTAEIPEVYTEIMHETGLTVVDVLKEGADTLLAILSPHFEK